MFNIGHKFDCLNRGCLPFKCQSLLWQTNRKKESKKNGVDKINNTHKVNDVKTPKSIPCSTSVSSGVVPGSFHFTQTARSLFFLSNLTLPVLLPYPFFVRFRATAVFNFLSHSLAVYINEQQKHPTEAARQAQHVHFICVVIHKVHSKFRFRK